VSTDQPAGRLLVVGSGLIGTSIGLAAGPAGWQVWIDDPDADRVRMATDIGAGQPWHHDDQGFDLAIVAAPPSVTGAVAASLIDSHVASTVSHVCSVQTVPRLDIETHGVSTNHFLGSHPIAGRERSGPHHASADLFRERPWIVCPASDTAPGAIAVVERLAHDCGGLVTRMSETDHDALFARLSHVPQLIASALAGSLTTLAVAEVALAGTGLQDTSRLADSDPDLWTEIVAGNRLAVAAALQDVVNPLLAVLDELQADSNAAAGSVRALLESGRDGRSLLRGKHGRRPVRWATVSVVVPDSPGKLARLFADAASCDVNVEDVRVDHAPGHPIGLVELDVRPEGRETLQQALRAHGWTVTSSPAPESTPARPTQDRP
jgi:prephenate dehydrogenase